MDPFSIAMLAAKAAKTLFDASETIYQFVQATREVDRTISGLLSQTKGLAQVLAAISSALQLPAMQLAGKEHHELWDQVGNSVTAADGIVERLHHEMKPLEKAGSNSLRQAWRQFNLGLKKDSIDTLLSEMRTHSVNLQLAVGMINLLKITSLPDRIAADMNGAVTKLEQMITVIDQRLVVPDFGDVAPYNELHSVSLNEHTTSLRKCAGSVISSASTAMGSSSATLPGRVVSSLDQPVFEHIEEDESEDLYGLEQSTTGSELGFPLHQTARKGIQNWLDQSPIPHDIPEVSAQISPTHGPSSILSDASVNTNTRNTEASSDLFEDCSEDELDLLVAQNIFRRADEKYIAKDFTGARGLIASGLTQARRLSLQNQITLQVGDMRLKMAFCYFREGSFDMAQDIFLSITKDPIEDTATLNRVLYALHGLAELNLRARNYEPAINHCRQAMRGRRRARSIGKTHPDYFASLRLLALIMWAQGNKTEAEAHADLLPEAQRLSGGDFSRILHAEYGIVEGMAEKPGDIPITQVSDPPKTANQPIVRNNIMTAPGGTSSKATRRRVAEGKSTKTSPTNDGGDFHHTEPEPISVSKEVKRDQAKLQSLPSNRSVTNPAEDFPGQSNPPLEDLNELEASGQYESEASVDNLTPMDLLIGVDVGMTYTGVAWNQIRDGLIMSSPSIISKWPGNSTQSDKFHSGHWANNAPVPTQLGYRNGVLSSWGFSVNHEDESAQEYERFERFKLLLDREEYERRKAENPEGVPRSHRKVQDAYRDFLRELYKYIEKQLEDRVRSWREARIEFSFAVPTTWTSPATINDFKRLVEESGFAKGGINHSVEISLTEAEAVAVYIQTSQLLSYEDGDVLLVVDAGRVTTDLALLKVNKKQARAKFLRALDSIRGYEIGGVCIDQAFVELATERLQQIKSSLRQKPEAVAWDMTLRGFQHHKEEFGTEDSLRKGRIRIRVPGLPDSFDAPLADIVNGNMIFTNNDLKQLFDEQIEKMFKLVDYQMAARGRLAKQDEITHIILSGGLGSSEYVKSRFKGRYVMNRSEVSYCSPGIRILTVTQRQLAVAKGLIQYRMHWWQTSKPIGSRGVATQICRQSLGVLCKKLYNPATHQGQAIYRDPVDGNVYATSQISWLMKRGQRIPEGYVDHLSYRTFLKDAPRVWTSQIVISHNHTSELPANLDRLDKDGAKVFFSLRCDLTGVPLSQFEKVSKPWWKGTSSIKEHYIAKYMVRFNLLPAGVNCELWFAGKRHNELLECLWAADSTATR